jgi:hypothetical protein
MRKWNWRRDNSDDMEIIAEWLNLYPEANWALLPDRVFIIDVDNKNGVNGMQSLIDAGGLPDTFTVRTPSVGHHYYLQPSVDMQPKTRNAWLKGIDIRYGPTGYVVLPHSTTQQGSYDVIREWDPLKTLPSVPEWIRSRWLNDQMVEPAPSRLLHSNTTNNNTLFRYQECNGEDKGWFTVRLSDQLLVSSTSD